jgi:hypothetical protein
MPRVPISVEAARALLDDKNPDYEIAYVYYVAWSGHVTNHGYAQWIRQRWDEFAESRGHVRQSTWEHAYGKRLDPPGWGIEATRRELREEQWPTFRAWLAEWITKSDVGLAGVSG